MGFLPKDLELLPPSDDRIFKLILTAPEAKPVLMDLISCILNRRVADVIVRNNELPPEDTQEKAERFDVNCRLEDDTQVDMEMQTSRIQEDADGQHGNLKGKSVYYLCDLHSSQDAKGVRRYDRLAQTWQITFCSYTVFPGQREFLNTFSLRNDRNGELLSDAVHAVFVELSKLQEILKKSVADMTDLEKWALFFQYADEPECRETINAVIASKEVLKVAGNLLMSVSRDERERAVFRSRKMYQTDRLSDLATAEDRGRAEGVRQGRAEGVRQGRIEIAARMLARNRPVEEIMEDTGLTEEEIMDLRFNGSVAGESSR